MLSRRNFVLATAGTAAAIAGAWVSFTDKIDPTQTLLRTKLRDLDGTLRTLEEWRPKVLVLNFWATWCEPCREEIPALVRARQNKMSVGLGAEFVGIALDQAAKVREFASKIPISYPILLGDTAGLALIKALGNVSGSLPFTVIVDAKGNIAWRHLGALSQELIEAKLDPILQP